MTYEPPPPDTVELRYYRSLPFWIMWAGIAVACVAGALYGYQSWSTLSYVGGLQTLMHASFLAVGIAGLIIGSLAIPRMWTIRQPFLCVSHSGIQWRQGSAATMRHISAADIAAVHHDWERAGKYMGEFFYVTLKRPGSLPQRAFEAPVADDVVKISVYDASQNLKMDIPAIREMLGVSAASP